MISFSILYDNVIYLQFIDFLLPEIMYVISNGRIIFWSIIPAFALYKEIKNSKKSV